ncbi:uncharacterized protein LOC119991100 isoform X3 [Tripterygium wilfordii]|uniref:uncharacterized protein LOC119991100 isoform X3 n=1 Tax=Tripterygium wilfordii TaxID=458696 RepID=UPI0018F81043|nr:uncharacterized protein LOC119991100 isoform X3 [Tripterygium wilfordii]XP_038693239.1 uncharacterized protein LOC119991100 isoform X3 [Tripterygium wilfordii]
MNSERNTTQFMLLFWLLDLMQMWPTASMHLPDGYQRHITGNFFASGHYTVRLLFQPTEGEAAASYITTVALGDAESIFGVNIDSQIPTGRRTRCFGARLIGSMKSWPPPTGDKDDRN